jgi:hypothetical protein
MRAYMLTIRDACRRPFATITIVMVANGRRQSLPATYKRPALPDLAYASTRNISNFKGELTASASDAHE